MQDRSPALKLSAERENARLEALERYDVLGTRPKRHSIGSGQPDPPTKPLIRRRFQAIAAGKREFRRICVYFKIRGYDSPA